MSMYAAQKLRDKASENDAGDPLKVQDVDYYYMAAHGKKGLEYERSGPKASWSKNATVKAQVLEAFKPFADGKELARRMSRVVNVAQMKDHLGAGGATAAEGDGAFADL